MRTRHILTVLLACMVTGSGCRKADKPVEAPGIRVVTGTVQMQEFCDRVRVQGSIEAVNKSRISALVPGSIDTMCVSKGDRVKKGAPLFQTDRINLESRVEIERQNLKVAEASVVAAAAGLRQAEAQFEKVSLDHGRFETLYAQKAISKDTYEKMVSLFKQTEAGTEQARAALSLAQARQGQAESSLNIARKLLADSLVMAPFDGVISARGMEAGEYAGAGAVVLTLLDPAALRISCHVAAAYFPGITPGVTTVRISSLGMEPVEVPVSYRGPSISTTTRTFEVQAVLSNATQAADGMLCDAEIILTRRQGAGVPTGAVSIRDGKPAVFVVDDGVARLVQVKPGIVDGGQTELLDATELQGRSIVIEGAAFLNDNTRVTTK